MFPSSSRRERRVGFTLVELLVVIGIIAVLIGILLPALQRAREAGNTIKCAANLRSIAQGLQIYLAENKQTYPPAYLYVGHRIEGNTQLPDPPQDGYIHWSSYLYKKGGSSKTTDIYRLGTSGWEAFTCPSMNNGGLPPTNTFDANHDSGNTNQYANVIDEQAPRIAYTVNEAIMPRNKFMIGFQGAVRIYRCVKASQVRRSAETILATELNNDWRVVSQAGGGSTEPVSKSHRPVHGYKGEREGELDPSLIPPGNQFGVNRKAIQRVVLNDLSADPSPDDVIKTRLDWVGRNHGRKRKETVAGRVNVDGRKSNFLYVDGHVDTKHVMETLQPFQWGENFYSLDPNTDVQTQ